jgi:hypothetical protein
LRGTTCDGYTPRSTLVIVLDLATTSPTAFQHSVQQRGTGAPRTSRNEDLVEVVRGLQPAGGSKPLKRQRVSADARRRTRRHH